MIDEKEVIKKEDTRNADDKSAGISRRTFLVRASVTAGTLVAAVATGQVQAFSSNEGIERWGMIVDLNKCIGCKACTVACKAENHTPPGVSYNVVMEEEIGEYPHIGRKFIFRPCMQCANSSCSKVCPTGASHKRDDGIIAINYDDCIGCKYCIAACPYGARSYDYGENYHETQMPYEAQPSPEYGEYRVREKGKSPEGNVRKCMFCLHRLKKGLAPACAETCIGHAIHFGNLKDNQGKCLVHGELLQELLSARNHTRLKEELGNEPSVYYLT